ncbi:MAG: TAXI family TRAP transporter solute-binding subunit [Pseudonocardiaceae bacterium]|nr:TAXI family TRAP transporter solute-binding subunit [Pseudonocardiaceae bacterium]
MRQHRLHRTLGAGIAVLATSAVLLAACSQPAEQDSTDETISSISIATGTTGGVYFPVGGAMAEILGNQVDGITATAEATGASVENIRLVSAGDSEIAISQGDVVYQAYNGEGDFGEAVDLRVLMVLYPNVYHAVSLQSIHDDSPMECFSDVAGSRFSVGAPGSGNEVATRLVFESLGMSFDDVDVQRYAYVETARALQEGQLDAGSWVVGEGHGTLRELEATDAIHLIPMCPQEVEMVTAEHPFYTMHTIAGGTYSTVEEDVDTIALWNVVVVDASFPDDLAYEVVKAIYENVALINQVYEPGEEYLVLDTLANSPAPLHPGAIRYAEEQGIDVPAELRP